ncbi:nuclear transport factor 2 family protein [Sphingoaurantiacus capsulatus]|uniref:Nuclear transport factor 2 family protein n=1 Tax=Sphingoaurantiacus capsulatus TaxID=1771310 RepID=A0ABV7XA50_9SPHN
MKLAIALAAAMMAAMPATAADPEAQIRARRAESNAAIAAHDAAAMRPHYLPDFTIMPGSSGAPSDLDAFLTRIGTTFADPTFVHYVRTPTKVTIGASGKRAAETGTWVGTWNKPDGTMRLSGVYQAMWLPTPDGWRLKNESFVSLACEGSAACATMD